MRPNFDYARRRGYEAALRLEERYCPYPDRRTKDGRATFSRAFRKAWYTGFWQGVGDRHKTKPAAPSYAQLPISTPLTDLAAF